MSASNDSTLLTQSAMTDALPAYDGPLPPKAADNAGKRGTRLARRAAPVVPVPVASAVGAAAPPQQPVTQPGAAPLQTFIPRLNRYVQAKVSKTAGEVGSYIEAASLLGPTASARQLATSVLPRLALYGTLPPSLVPQLLPVLASDDRRAARLAAYLLQVQLGCGTAGTPTLPPTRGGEVLVPAPVPVEIMARAWHDIVREDADNAGLQGALRNLVAAARGYPKLLQKDLATGIEIVLDRAGQVNPLQAAGKKTQDESANLRRSAMLATRAGMADATKPTDRISRRILRQVISTDPIAARHALALAVEVARKDPRGVLEGLGPTITESAILYETSDLKKLLDPNRPAAAPKDGASVDTINFADKFGRVHLARLCSAVCHSERTAGALAGDAFEFFRMLALLATRDESSLVGIEAIRALAGHFPPRKASLGLDGKLVEVSAQDVRCRGRAWQVLLAQSEMEARGNSRSSGTQVTLIGVVGERLIMAMQSNSPALVCSAARAAGALGEARTRSGIRSRKRGQEAANVMQELADGLTQIAEGPAGPAIRCAALEALFWFQAPGQPPKITPLSLLRNVTSSGVGQAAWPRDLLESVMGVIAQAERAMPTSSQLLMSCAGAAAAASPSGVNLSRIVEMWTTALRAGRTGKEAALHAALGVLSSPSPPSASAPTDASVEVLARAASEDAAWLAFQRMSAWWLGEHANVAAGEFAGTSGMEADSFEGEGVIKPPSGRVEIATHNKPLSAGEVIALQASENPAMMAVVSQLQHAVLTMPWEVRIAAAQAIAKVAVRSEEPYRIHCYSILRSLAASDHAAGNDALGVAAIVAPAVRILDMVYATRITLEDLAKRYGGKPLQWPVHVVEQLTARNTAILTAIEEQIGTMPPGQFHPLGPVGKELLKAAATEGLEAFKGGLEWQAAAAEAEQAALRGEHDESGRDGADITLDPEAEKQPALGADGKPVWMQRLLGLDPSRDGGAAGGSSDEEGQTPQAQQTSTFVLPQGGADPLADMMSQLDQRLAGPHRQRASWERLPTPAETYASSEWQQPPSPQQSAALQWPPPARAVTPSAAHGRHASHSRNSSWADVTPRKPLEGKAQVLHDFQAADDQELTVFKDQEVTLQYETDGWIMATTETGRSGLIPNTYLQILSNQTPFQDDPFGANQQADPFAGGDPFAGPSGAKSTAHDDPFAGAPADDPFAGPDATQDPFAEEQPGVRIRHAPRPSLLNFDTSQFEGAHNGQQGASSRTSFDDAAGEEPSFSNNLQPAVVRNGTAIHAFTPESEEELALAKGDTVEVEGQEIEGWLQVTKLSDGSRGLVPSWAVEAS